MGYLIYENIYRKLERLGVLSLVDRGVKSAKAKSIGFMDLNYDLLSTSSVADVVALSHLYKQGGDLIPDPDMTIRIYREQPMAEALTYQDSMGFRRVYDDGMIDAKAKRELNNFLDYWLGNLKKQGFKFKVKK